MREELTVVANGPRYLQQFPTVIQHFPPAVKTREKSTTGCRKLQQTTCTLTHIPLTLLQINIFNFESIRPPPFLQTLRELERLTKPFTGIAVHLPFVSQCSYHLYGSTVGKVLGAGVARKFMKRRLHKNLAATHGWRRERLMEHRFGMSLSDPEAEFLPTCEPSRTRQLQGGQPRRMTAGEGTLWGKQGSAEPLGFCVRVLQQVFYYANPSAEPSQRFRRLLGLC